METQTIAKNKNTNGSWRHEPWIKITDWVNAGHRILD